MGLYVGPAPIKESDKDELHKRCDRCSQKMTCNGFYLRKICNFHIIGGVSIVNKGGELSLESTGGLSLES